MMPSRPRRRVLKGHPAAPDIWVIFGRNLQSLRLSQERTQQNVADAAGLSREYVSLAETARANLTRDAMERLAAALGAPLSELLCPTSAE